MVYSQVKEELPQDGKEDALETIRDDSRLQTPTKQAEDTILQDDQPRSLGCIVMIIREKYYNNT